ncbi:hypothetical protein F511_12624 [Dorcoceras hygrometricum]|uniref:Reverse transcriptase Ty1/copia-type domain-containing protein n=1 Tax=Dorcoceras hygrometricum TaxID=472368 RepID=A0A2Z7CTV2_9LAMI|nr:hypothetical protein F511_12624 [Dorcoceras hygrometricum]
MELDQMDVKTAFLHGDLCEEIYMKQPRGFEHGASDKVCLLKKSLYGLKQSPRQWYIRFDQFMEEIGFSRSKFDTCVYVKNMGTESQVYLMLYVDDMLIASKDRRELDRIKGLLGTEFEMKDMGAASRILGIDIKRNRKEGTLFLSQEAYISKVLNRFSMKDSKPVTVPLGPQFRLSVSQAPKNTEEIDYMNKVPYASAVGSVMYCMVCTRPDLAHAISVISRFMANPGKEHWRG